MLVLLRSSNFNQLYKQVCQLAYLFFENCQLADLLIKLGTICRNVLKMV